MMDIVEELRWRAPMQEPQHSLMVQAANEIERLLAKVAYLEEVVKAQSSHMHPDASGSYSGTGSAY